MTPIYNIKILFTNLIHNAFVCAHQSAMRKNSWRKIGHTVTGIYVKNKWKLTFSTWFANNLRKRRKILFARWPKRCSDVIAKSSISGHHLLVVVPYELSWLFSYCTCFLHQLIYFVTDWRLTIRFNDCKHGYAKTEISKISCFWKQNR